MLAATDLASAHQLGIWDAVILSAAADARCRILLSEDLQDGFTWRGRHGDEPVFRVPTSVARRIVTGRTGPGLWTRVNAGSEEQDPAYVYDGVGRVLDCGPAGSRQRKHEDVRRVARLEFRRHAVVRSRDERRSGRHRDVLLAVDREGHREAADRRAEIHLPQHLAGSIVERLEAAVGVATEHETAAGRDEREHARALLVLPERLSGLGGDRPHRADVGRARCDHARHARGRRPASDRAGRSVVVAFMHMFCSGMYIALVVGL